MAEKSFVHPYIPNSEPAVKKEMLDFLGMESSEDIYKEIPDNLRFKGQMDLPEPILSEARLQRHVEELLAKNRNAKDTLNFLGGGTWNHYVPAVCDTIGARDEFLTAYVGETYSDHGKWQALFETASMIGELTGFHAAGTPTYDWANAVAIACRMACRTAGKQEVLLPKNMSPSRMKVVKNYMKPEIAVKEVAFDPKTGRLDIADLREKLSEKTAAVYFENPCYLGAIETDAREIIQISKDAGALVIAGVDPSALGVLEAPGVMGADYAVGDYQPLGLHMSFGGSLSGFICTKDEERFVAEYPSLLFGITDTIKEGEYGFGEVFFERTSYASREKGKDFIGTTTALHGIVAGVYMALMGPQGFYELGSGILQRSAYAKKKLAGINGIDIPLEGVSYCDFIVSFEKTGKTVAEINAALLKKDIFGGKDISGEFPALGQSALYSVTEMHSKEDIDKLVSALEAVCGESK